MKVNKVKLYFAQYQYVLMPPIGPIIGRAGYCSFTSENRGDLRARASRQGRYRRRKEVSISTLQAEILRGFRQIFNTENLALTILLTWAGGKGDRQLQRK